MYQIINSQQLTLPDSAEDWLQQLSRPTIIEITGSDKSRWRIFSVLIHGNEPSGFMAAFNYLKQNPQPYTNIAICISSIRAAKLKPRFSHRFVPGEFDLNRRFGRLDCRDQVSELARDLTDYLRSKNPEFVIDLHNTSGQGPAFSVSISDHPSIRKLTAVFSDKMVLTQLIVGSLMEQNFNCPTVTIECGYMQDPQADKIALTGLERLTSIPSIDELDEEPISLFSHPLRVQVQPGTSVDYAAEYNPDVDITLRKDIGQLNYNKTKAGTHIGWINRKLEQSLSANNEHNENTIDSLFEVSNNQLLIKKDCYIFMATSVLEIALNDCLFYVADA